MKENERFVDSRVPFAGRAGVPVCERFTGMGRDCEADANDGLGSSLSEPESQVSSSSAQEELNEYWRC